MVSSRLCQLLLHLVVVDLECAQLELVLVRLQLGQLELLLQFLNFGLAFTIDLVEANHFALVHLQLTSRVLEVLHQLLGLFLVDVEQLLRLFKLKRQVLLLTLKAVARALEHVHLEFHLSVLLLRILDLVSADVEGVLDLLRANVVFLQLAALDVQLAARRLQFFALLRDFSLVLSLSSLQLSDFISAVLKSLVQHLDVFLSGIEILKDSFVPCFEISVG